MGHHFREQEKYDQAAMPSRRSVLKGILAGAVAGAPAAVAADPVHDPLIDAIAAFHAGNAAFCALKEDDWPFHGGEDAVIEATYLPPMQALMEWDRPALTWQGLVAALRLARSEHENFSGSDITKQMLSAALGFLEMEGL